MLLCVGVGGGDVCMCGLSRALGRKQGKEKEDFRLSSRGWLVRSLGGRGGISAGR